MDKLESAIIKTLAYADLFNQALTTEELSKYLIQHELKDIKWLSKVQSPSFKHQDNTWTLNNRNELAKQKKYQLQTTNYKLQTAQKSLWIFRLIPWINLVAITGSVAGGTPTADDDIDLLIITDRNRLWLTRLILILLLNLTGRRRKPTDDPRRVNNKLCLNMWLSIDNLNEEYCNLYVANELAHIIPILNRHQTYEQYIHINNWITDFLPNFPTSQIQPSAFSLQPSRYPSRSSASDLRPPTPRIPLTEMHYHPELASGSSLYKHPNLQILNQVQDDDTPLTSSLVTRHSSLFTASRILSWLDSLAHKFQQRIMRQPTKETIQPNRLAFHPHDYQSEIMKKYHQKLAQLGLK